MTCVMVYELKPLHRLQFMIVTEQVAPTVIKRSLETTFFYFKAPQSSLPLFKIYITRNFPRNAREKRRKNERGEK
jgi:hypothetical protein